MDYTKPYTPPNLFPVSPRQDISPVVRPRGDPGENRFYSFVMLLNPWLIGEKALTGAQVHPPGSRLCCVL
jgi:hypothetical protein